VSHYKNYAVEGHFKEHKDTRESIAVFADFDLVAEPGTRYGYSSYGFNLLGAVIEEASGQPYGEFMRSHVWAPLGMNATRLDDPVAIIPDRVSGYTRGADGELVHSEFIDISSRFAAGGTRSTVPDLLRFGRGLLDGAVLPSELRDLMWTTLETREGLRTGYGLGWGVGSTNGRFTVAHGGAQAETRTYLFIAPTARLVIAAAFNLEDADRMPYVRRLYTLILDEPWEPAAYTEGPDSAALYAALESVFRNGVSYFDRHGNAPSIDRGAVSEAFAYFERNIASRLLSSDMEAARKSIVLGSEPAAGAPYELMGATMTSRLVERNGADYIELLHRGGPLTLFRDWVDLSREDREIPKALRLDKKLESRIRTWSDDWHRTWSRTARRQALTPTEEPEAAIAALEESFEGASIYPDYWPSLAPIIEASYLAGRLDRARALVDAGRRIYPGLAGPWLYAGLIRLASGEGDQARSSLRQAKSIDPRRTAGPGALNGWAYRFKAQGQLELGLQLLAIARDLYPQDANLCDSMGEMYLDKGDREQAIRWYRKALEVDPDFTNASRMLDQLRPPSEE
jgi:hypothetical protein